MEWLSTLLQAFARPFTWWVVVASWEQGLRVRLGKQTKLLRPGVHLRIPFLDRIYVQSTRLRVVSCQGQSFSAGDGRTVTVSLSVRYAVRDIVLMYEAASAPEAVLLFEACRAASSYVSGRGSHDVSSEGLREFMSRATSAAADALGLRDVAVTITSFCVVRTLRLITGEGWVGSRDMDYKEHSGERR